MEVLELKETLPTLQSCLLPDQLTVFHKKEKIKITERERESKVCCVQGSKLTEEKEGALRARMHVLDASPA